MQNDDLVMTHDGARPFITESLVQRLVEAADEDSIAIPSLPVFETVRKRDTLGNTSVVDRQHLYTVQTPQVFHVKQIPHCFLNGDKRELKLTDEASYFEVAEKRVKLVEGEKWNLKLTTPEDILWAEFLLQQHKALQLGDVEKL
jgi:2-C-methyl-D-erythritol 4-phosphate cytidylyltransferase